jgi:hypothetical protein
MMYMMTCFWFIGKLRTFLYEQASYFGAFIVWYGLSVVQARARRLQEYQTDDLLLPGRLVLPP